MKSLPALLLALIATVSSAFAQLPQLPEFTYQGRLEQGGVAADGTFDLTFSLYDDVTGGNQVGQTITETDFPVTDGVFTVSLSFPGAFVGDQLWIEVSVDGQPLTPRQAISTTPVAQYALDGNPGPEGPIGATGPQGATGPAGPIGNTGPAGSPGDTGPAGPAGPAGQTGATGAQGPAGATGPQGLPGPAGATGPQGVAGPPGATGPQGASGPQGAVGPQGNTGPQGVAGPAGSVGPQGPAGAQGPQGEPGVGGNPADAVADATSTGDVVARFNELLDNMRAAGLLAANALDLSGELPDGSQSVSYGASLNLAGGVPPYTWSISTGALPPGLSINPASGAVSGIPTTQGLYTFTVQVTDAQSSLATRLQDIQIFAPPSAWATFSPVRTSSSGELRDSNRRVVRVAAVGNYATALSSQPLSGKVYFEGIVNLQGAATASTAIGVWTQPDSGQPTNTYVGFGTDSTGAFPRQFEWHNYYNANITPHGNLPVDSSATPFYRFGIAVDVPNRQVWLRQVTVSSSGIWAGNGDPATGTLPSRVLTGTGPLFAAGSTGTVSEATWVDLVSDPMQMWGTPPAGFTAGIPAN